MHVLVTGGAGFIGAHSGRALLEAGHRVTALDDLSHGKREAVPRGADFLELYVRSPQLVAELERLRPDAVLHLAAQMDVRRSVADPMHDASVNVLGTVNVYQTELEQREPSLMLTQSSSTEFTPGIGGSPGSAVASIVFPWTFGPKGSGTEALKLSLVGAAACAAAGPKMNARTRTTRKRVGAAIPRPYPRRGGMVKPGEPLRWF